MVICLLMGLGSILTVNGAVVDYVFPLYLFSHVIPTPMVGMLGKLYVLLHHKRCITVL